MGPHPKHFTGADLYCVASGWLGRLGADIRIGLLLIFNGEASGARDRVFGEDRLDPL